MLLRLQHRSATQSGSQRQGPLKLYKCKVWTSIVALQSLTHVHLLCLCKTTQCAVQNMLRHPVMIMICYVVKMMCIVWFSKPSVLQLSSILPRQVVMQATVGKAVTSSMHALDHELTLRAVNKRSKLCVADTVKRSFRRQSMSNNCHSMDALARAGRTTAHRTAASAPQVHCKHCLITA